MSVMLAWMSTRSRAGMGESYTLWWSFSSGDGHEADGCSGVFPLLISQDRS